MMVEFGRTVKLLRQTMDLSSGDLAHAAGISRPMLSLLESGARQPSLSVLRRVAAALNVPSETLVILAMDDSTKLSATDSRVTDLAESIRKMMEMENLLRCQMGGKRTGEAKGSNPE